MPSGRNFSDVKALVEQNRLHTVCQSARCPNVGECWNRRTATFMLLGDVCTRNCAFCAVSSGQPEALDPDEPRRIAEAVDTLELNYAVVTSVTRDDLPDGGASVFAETVAEIKHVRPQCKVEVLIPDFQGSVAALNLVLDAGPDVLNHNVETVARLYPVVRPQANYERSLGVLSRSKERGTVTKSGFMVGLGEAPLEVLTTMRDLRDSGCDLLTIGQYLQPTREHLPIDRFVTPEEFDQLSDQGLAMEFSHVESGPLVRSSYHADQQAVLASRHREQE